MEELKSIYTKAKAFIESLNEDEKVIGASVFMITWVSVAVQPAFFGFTTGIMLGASAIIIKRKGF